MKSILNADFLYIAGYIGLSASFPEDINPYVIFVGGIIALLVGIGNIIKFLYWFKTRNN